MSIRFLIIDDEPLIRAGIRKELAGADGLECVGECANGGEAIQLILAIRPDLIFLDVQMPDCSGLDVVREIGPHRMPMVVFVTAYDEYAVKAFEFNAVDYVLKPFEGGRLRASVERARERFSRGDPSVLIQRLETIFHPRYPKWPERLVVRDADRYTFVSVQSIDWIESANNYVQLHCGNRTHLLSETLTGLEERLDPSRFVRIHRRKLINIENVVAAHRLFNGIYAIELRNGLRLTTGRQYKHAVQELIGR